MEKNKKGRPLGSKNKTKIISKNNSYQLYPTIECNYGNDSMSNTKKWVDTYYAEEGNNETTPS